MDRNSPPWHALEGCPGPASDPGAQGPSPAPSPRIARQWLLVAAGLALATVLAGAAFVVGRVEPSELVLAGAAVERASPAGSGAGSSAAAAAGTDNPTGAEAGPVLVVDVGGAVARPGVYRLPAGSRVGDAIAAAGGFGPRVDAAAASDRLNLAAPLRDGDRVRVPSRDDRVTASGAPTSGEPAGGGTTPGSDGPVNLNTASSAELEALPGIGPVTAAKIIAAREATPFAAVEDLRTRKIVGQATYAKLAGLVTVGP